MNHASPRPFGVYPPRVIGLAPRKTHVPVRATPPPSPPARPKLLESVAREVVMKPLVKLAARWMDPMW